MKTIIKTKTAGEIIIESNYLGDTLWSADNKMQNYNNSEVKVTHDGKSYSFDFWGSIVNPEIQNDQENVFAFYCSLSDALGAKDSSFEDFCSEFGYSDDSIKASNVYEKCEETLIDIESVFDCDLYDLINEIQEDYEC